MSVCVYDFKCPGVWFSSMGIQPVLKFVIIISICKHRLHQNILSFILNIYILHLVNFKLFKYINFHISVDVLLLLVSVLCVGGV